MLRWLWLPILVAGCSPAPQAPPTPEPLTPAQVKVQEKDPIAKELERQLALSLKYDPAYTSNGKPKPGTGVCTDVVIRLADSQGIDLQKLVTDEVRKNPRAYEVSRPDPGIDHRRCRTIIHWFRKYAESVPAGAPYALGEIVFYRTAPGRYIDHVGVIGPGNTLVDHWPGRPVRQIPIPDYWEIAGRFKLPEGGL